MKHCLNTLYVTTQGAWLAKDGENVVVRVEREERFRTPIHLLAGIVCFGNVSTTPALLGHCAETGVSVSFLTEYGRYLAEVRGPVSGNVLLRREQYRRAESEAASAALACHVVSGKLHNCRVVLSRGLRDHGEGDEARREGLAHAARAVGECRSRLRPTHDLDVIRGIEGEGANAYFAAFDHLVTARAEEFRFRGRSRRPPLDPVNCLLSFVYTLLVHDVRSALETVGLDPQVGFLHRDRPGRPSLALDVMEEFRPFVADRLVLSLVNMGQVKPKGFVRTPSGAVRMDDGTRRTVLEAYQGRKREEVEHPFLGEKMPLGLLWFAQARLLARHLRGDIDGYPPFLWR